METSSHQLPLKQTFSRFRNIIIIVLLIWAGWWFGLGALGVWFLNKGSLEKFPQLSASDRILILAPHIDDETICCAGLIQEVKQTGGQVKIVYLTNGDDSLGAVIKEDKSLQINPNDFIKLGESRMDEGRQATQILGLTEDNLIFLGYPDEGLSQMLNKFYDEEKPYTSRSTHLSYNPYSDTYESEQTYTGNNLVTDLTGIVKNYRPTLIIVSHPQDKHSDHRAAFLFLEKVLKEENLSRLPVFTYLVHYSLFPSRKVLSSQEFLFPPRRLFSQEGWFSLDLTPTEINSKLQAVNQYTSQAELRPFYDLLLSFVKKNEIYEKVDIN